MVFLFLLIVPLLIGVVGFIFLKGFTWKEFLIHIGAAIVIAASSAGIVSCANTHDVEILNGRVVSKAQVWVPCSHSYQCHCHQVSSGSGKNQSSHEECDTCYRHLNDYDWDVRTSINSTITINRIDSQGSYEPPRFTRVVIGEPISVEHSYDNFIKGAPDTLFRHQGLKEKYLASIPKHPEVYDYYRIDRLITIGVSLPDQKQWNDDLSTMNADVGSSKQVNAGIILVKNMPVDYYYGLEEAWIGGRKNEVWLITSVNDDLKPQWVLVMAWTNNEFFKIKLRDDVMNLPALTRTETMTIFRSNIVANYQRKPMKDFQYLEASITPTPTEWTITLIIGIVVALGLLYFFATQEVLK